MYFGHQATRPLSPSYILPSTISPPARGVLTSHPAKLAQCQFAIDICKRPTCRNTIRDPQCLEKYFEVWRVYTDESGVTHVYSDWDAMDWTSSPPAKGQKGALDHFAHVGFRKSTKGRYQKLGSAVFVQMSYLLANPRVLGFLTDGFGTGGRGVLSACNLFSACSTGQSPADELWNHLLSHPRFREVAEYKRTRKIWNCCSEQNENERRATRLGYRIGGIDDQSLNWTWVCTLRKNLILRWRIARAGGRSR
jgi:hypothetical protein